MQVRKDGNASVSSKYFYLSPRRNHFSSWLSSKESPIEWIEQRWIALCKTDLFIVFIQAFLLSFLLLCGSLSFYLFSFCVVVCYKRHVCLILTSLSNLSHTSDLFCFVKVLFDKVWPEHSLYDKNAKGFASHSKLVEEFWRISNFICIGLLRVYQVIINGDVMKKIKVNKNTMLDASSDILALLGESHFETRKWCCFWHEHWSLVMLKI